MVRRLKAIFRSTRQLLGIIIIALFCCPLSLSGLDPDKPLDQYLVDKWDISVGIPSNSILSITQTPDGYLWIATTKGLVRFDGMKFSPIRLAEHPDIDPMKSAMPNILFKDREGILWFESAAGLTSYRYQTGQFQTFTSADGITRDGIRHIKDDMRGNLWICFDSSYVNRFFNGEFTAYNASHGLEGKKINAIVEDAKGNLLFGSRESGAGVFIYRDGKFFKYPIAGLDDVEIISMYGDRIGDLWIGTNNGLFRVTEKRTEKYTTKDGLSDNFITSIIEDSDRNLWVGTVKGLNRIKTEPDGTIRFEPLLKLAHFTIFCVFEDREKSLWIGTYKSGIRRLKEGKFISYAPLEDLQEEFLFSLFQDGGGDIWIGAYGGKLFRCRDNDLIETVEPPELSSTGIISIAEDAQGNLWLSTTGKGAFQKKNKTFVQWTTRDGLVDNTVTSILRDSQGNLWFSTFDGVSKIPVSGYINKGQIVIESLNSRNGLKGKKVHNVYEDKNNNIWIAADNGITVLKDGKIEKKNMKYYLPGNSVTCIYEDVYAPGNGSKGKRVYWIATHGGGLKRLTLKDGIVTSYTTADGMASDFIYQFFEDKQRNFWLMSSSGILRVSKNELNRFATGSLDIINCTSFGTADGLKSLELDNEFSRNSALRTRNGEFWFITKKGISIVNPATVHINKIPPQVVIEAVYFNWQSIRHYLHREIKAFKGITDFRFHFTATTFLSPEKIKFKYKLKGSDRRWVYLPPGRERVAQYKDLEPGTYTFNVIACNSDGVWTRTGDSLTFILKPLFYQTLLFKAGILFMFILGVAAAFYIYKKRPFARKITYKSKVSPPEPQFVDRCIKKLTYLMEFENLYRHADLSLRSLAEKMSISTHLLSQILNEELNQNFADFINSYRIKEAQKILQSPRGAQKKMAVVAFEVGFNTVVAFYNAFKKYTNMTPVQYKKKAKNKK
ncbi:MAG: helix-turn-helix domain-containing protein [Candidatus Aminicenantes bacterium]|nr:helix-turn-helix domain-containing protein [Candidatus Aminicenantes bacterium]NIM81058.1 helix-turn-helix domain-containing protein [Candidatus Aminicenantes bacterium]NIN20435.1 helix-turn-helix domain-containing protein [Candidatus Aminicenantes bacterium]NIN44208.1 helix-turn-helix domain-containing protein [Candidatus Aminicenantes bacterium]NIN87026.1 helix-turn-helix domain-containing protein [Candidatus Aminicenantes bacterium]